MHQYKSAPWQDISTHSYTLTESGVHCIANVALTILHVVQRSIDRSTDRLADRQTDGRTDGRTDRRTDGQTERGMEGEDV